MYPIIVKGLLHVFETRYFLWLQESPQPTIGNYLLYIEKNHIHIATLSKPITFSILNVIIPYYGQQ